MTYLQPCGHPVEDIVLGEEWAPGQFNHWCGRCAEIDEAVKVEREKQAELRGALAALYQMCDRLWMHRDSEHMHPAFIAVMERAEKALALKGDIP